MVAVNGLLPFLTVSNTTAQRFSVYSAPLRKTMRGLWQPLSQCQTHMLNSDHTQTKGKLMTTQEILDLLAQRAANARIVRDRHELETESFTHERHWELFALCIEDIAAYIRHNSTN